MAHHLGLPCTSATEAKVVAVRIVIAARTGGQPATGSESRGLSLPVNENWLDMLGAAAVEASSGTLLIQIATSPAAGHRRLFNSTMAAAAITTAS